MYVLQESSVIQNYEGFQLDRSVYCLLNSISGAGNIPLSFAYPFSLSSLVHNPCFYIWLTKQGILDFNIINTGRTPVIIPSFDILLAFETDLETKVLVRNTN